MDKIGVKLTVKNKEAHKTIVFWKENTKGEIVEDRRRRWLSSRIYDSFTDVGNRLRLA